MTPAHPASPATTVWIGTFPAAGIGTTAGLGEGIWRGRVDERTGAVTVDSAEPVVRAPAPTFLALHPSGRVLYAGVETDPGAVTAYGIDDDGGLAPLAPALSSAGANPCHVALSGDARTLYVANYSSGSVGVIPLDADGAPAADALAAGGAVQRLDHEGTGPDTDRQEGPHAHFVLVVPGAGSARAGVDPDLVLVVDLGTDELRRYVSTGDPARPLEADGVVTLPPGTGPRHAVLAPDLGPAVPGPLLYVAGELDSTVHVVRLGAVSGERDEILQTLPAVATVAGARSSAESAEPAESVPSHIALLPGLGSGADHVATLLVAVRGADVLSSFAVGPDGLLTPLGTTPTGSWPRHFAVLPAVAGEGRPDQIRVAIAVERGHEVRTVALGASGEPVTTGSPDAPVILGSTGTTIASPACIVPAR